MSRQGAYDDINNPYAGWYRHCSSAEREAIYAEMRPAVEPVRYTRISDFFPRWGAAVARRERRERLTFHFGANAPEKILAEYRRLRAEASIKDTTNAD